MIGTLFVLVTGGGSISLSNPIRTRPGTPSRSRLARGISHGGSQVKQGQ
jgi:hypothetical protein